MEAIGDFNHLGLWVVGGRAHCRAGKKAGVAGGGRPGETPNATPKIPNTSAGGQPKMQTHWRTGGGAKII